MSGNFCDGYYKIIFGDLFLYKNNNLVMDWLKRSLLSAPIIEKDGYHYFVHPISDGVPMLEPGLLREIIVKIINKADLENIDKIVTPAAMGIHISTALSLVTDIPLVVVRKRQYGLEGEVSLTQVTGYAKNEMYINDIKKGDRILLLDDVISTGGTILAIMDALEKIGAEVIDVVAVISKVGNENVMKNKDWNVKTLINIDVIDGKVVIIDENGNG